MLPVWLITTLPLWLVVFIILYAVAALYVAIKYREVRKFLAGAFFVSSGILCYLWVTGTSLPIVLPYAGTVAVETQHQWPARHRSFHFVLTLLVFRFLQQTERFSVRHLGALQKSYASAPPWMIATNVRFGS